MVFFFGSFLWIGCISDIGLALHIRSCIIFYLFSHIYLTFNILNRSQGWRCLYVSDEPLLFFLIFFFLSLFSLNLLFFNVCTVT